MYNLTFQMCVVCSTIASDMDNSTLSTKTPLIQVSTDTFRVFSLVANVILTQIICVIGLVGNSIGLIVLWRDPNKKKLTIYTYLFALMVIDTIFLAIGIYYSINDIIEYYDRYLGNIIKRHVWIAKAYTLTLHKHLLAVLLIIMSTERLMSLLRPYDVKNFCLSKYPRTITVLSSIITAVYLIPMHAGFRIESHNDEFNKTVYSNTVDPGYFETFVIVMYVETAVLHYVAPLTVLVLNILTALCFSRFVRQRQSKIRSESGCDNQRRVTIIVFCVAALYLLLSLPNLFLQTLIFIDDSYSFYGQYNLVFYLFMDLGDLFVRFNAATDFIVYILVVRRYRNICKAMFCKCNSVRDETFSDLALVSSSTKSQ